MQHGTIINELDTNLHSSLFNLSPEFLGSKVTSLQDHITISRQSFYKVLQASILDGFEWKPSELTNVEHAIFKTLTNKYSSDEWTNQPGLEKGACYTQF